jgi:hypothetical protein
MGGPIFRLMQCEESSRTQLDRLRLARALLRDNIPCVVWAEEALSFGNRTFYTLVPNVDLQRAASNVTTTPLSHPRLFDVKCIIPWIALSDAQGLMPEDTLMNSQSQWLQGKLVNVNIQFWREEPPVRIAKERAEDFPRGHYHHFIPPVSNSYITLL